MGQSSGGTVPLPGDRLSILMTSKMPPHRTVRFSFAGNGLLRPATMK
jgi:hypothetical protein